jgi:CRP/FNR family transcriptional regulator
MQLTKEIDAIPLFQGLSQEYLDELAMIVTSQEFKRGQTIFSEGEKGVGFYVVLTGKVKIYKLSFDGKEQILHILGAGEPFAEVAVFAGVNFPAHAMAIENSRVLFFPKTSFIDLIGKNPPLALNMLAVLAMRLRKFTNMIESLSLKEVPGRLAAHLLLLSSQQNNANVLQLNVAKTQLASMLGTIPETLSRILKKMNSQGFINSQSSSIQLLDRKGLEELAIGERRIT